MTDNIVLIHRSKRMPGGIHDDFKPYWQEATSHFRMGEAPVPVMSIARSLGQGDTLAFESMRVMMDFGTRSRPSWSRAWEIVAPMVGRGARIVWIREGVGVGTGLEDTVRTLQAIASAEAEYRAELAEARLGAKEGSEKAKESYGWIQPDKAMLNRLAAKAKELGVTQACKDEGVSRRRYYEWREKNLLP